MLEIRLQTKDHNYELFENLFFEFAAQAVSIEPLYDIAILEPKPGTTPLWQDIIIIGIFDANIDCLALIKQIYNLGINETQLSIQAIDANDETWLNFWQKNFTGFSIGQQLWIYPAWEEINNQYPHQIKINPGLSFGTGTHPTTRLCLQWLCDNIKPNMHCIDYGAGSGILALAAIGLGANFVHAIDYDPQAIISTNNNASLNNFSNKITAILPVDFNLQAYAGKIDCVFANILAQPLIELAPAFKQLIAPHGKLAITGILAEQVADIIKNYIKNSLKCVNKQQDQEWVLLEFLHA